MILSAISLKTRPSSPNSSFDLMLTRTPVSPAPSRFAPSVNNRRGRVNKLEQASASRETSNAIPLATMITLRPNSRIGAYASSISFSANTAQRSESNSIGPYALNNLLPRASTTSRIPDFPRRANSTLSVVTGKTPIVLPCLSIWSQMFGLNPFSRSAFRKASES